MMDGILLYVMEGRVYSWFSLSLSLSLSLSHYIYLTWRSVFSVTIFAHYQHSSERDVSCTLYVDNFLILFVSFYLMSLSVAI